ncbi:hypothetical protein LCGC14_2749590, partial [marine sediment metagenome]
LGSDDEKSGSLSLRFSQSFERSYLSPSRSEGLSCVMPLRSDRPFSAVLDDSCEPVIHTFCSNAATNANALTSHFVFVFPDLNEDGCHLSNPPPYCAYRSNSYASNDRCFCRTKSVIASTTPHNLVAPPATRNPFVRPPQIADEFRANFAFDDLAGIFLRDKVAAVTASFTTLRSSVSCSLF